MFVGSEMMNVTAAVDHGDGTQTWTVTRGLNGSTAAAHAVGIPVFGGADVELGVLLRGLSVADQDRTTLEELFGALPPDILNATNLGELLSAIASATGITLDDLLLALLGQQDLPWEQLDIGSVNLQTYASPQTLITFTGTLVVNGDGPQDVEANATIPADFAYVPGSSSLGGTPIADPAVSGSSGGQQLKWTLLQVPVGTSSLTFQVEPGIALGTETVSAEAHLRSVGTPNPTVSSDVAVTNTAPSAASIDANNPTTMSPDTLYLGHISAGQTSNFFRLTIAGGQRVSLLLGNLPADYDLIFYDASAAATHLRLSPSGSVIPVSDPAPSLTPAQDSLPPETLQDLPLVAGSRVYDVSANRGLKDEEIDTGTLPAGQYLVQVAGYNGATSDLPYSLRARITNDAAATCPGTHTFQFPTDQAPAFTPPQAPAATVFDTVVLMDPDRLAKTWGAAAVQPVWNALTAFMNAYGKAQLVQVEDNQATRDAYTAWDADPCAVDGANGVVKAIGAQLDALLAQNPNIKFVTVVGSDDQIPMARLRDAARIANERGRAPDFGDAANALASVFSGGFLLTDDVYAQQHPLAVRVAICTCPTCRLVASSTGRTRSPRRSPTSRPRTACSPRRRRASSPATTSQRRRARGRRLPHGGPAQSRHLADQQHVDPRRSREQIARCPERGRVVRPLEADSQHRFGERALRRAEPPPRDRQHEQERVGALQPGRCPGRRHSQRRHDAPGRLAVQHGLSRRAQPPRRDGDGHGTRR